MTNADVVEKVEGAVTTYSDDQQLDAALSEKLARYDAIHAICSSSSSFITRSLTLYMIPHWHGAVLQAVRISREGLEQNRTTGCRHSRCQPVCPPLQ